MHGRSALGTEGVCGRLMVVVALTLTMGAVPQMVTPALAGQAAATSAEGTVPGASAAGQPAEAASRKLEVSFGASATFVSAFVWRGFVVGDHPSFQPSLWVKIGPVTINSWSNAFLRSDEGAVYTEHDFSVDYSREVRGVTLSVGWINYLFPRETTGRFTNELYASVTGGGYLRPRLQVFHDLNEGNGTYVGVSVGHEYALGTTKATLTPSLNLGYNHHQWTERTGFSELSAGLVLSVPTPIPRLSVQPYLNYTYGFDTAIFPRRFYGGVTVIVE